MLDVRGKPPGVPGATDGRLIALKLRNDKEIKALGPGVLRPDYPCQISG
jgi:hypothetical protein